MGTTITVTNAGRAALVNAANTGTAPVTLAQVGLSATAFTPAVTDTALPGEFKRLATISGDVVDDDTIHVIVRDEGNDTYTVRSLGLYLDDGTLFAVYAQAGAILEKSAQALLLLPVDIQFADIDAASLTFGDANFLNPPATTEVQGVVELSTLEEAIAGTSKSRVPAEKMIRDAVAAWLDARFGANNSGIWHPGNDGAGSGLDADMLDGYRGVAYALRNDDVAFRDVVADRGDGTGVIYLTRNRYLYFNGSQYILPSNNLNVNGGLAWHSGNDGAGSGLDADLLDGKQASAFGLLDGSAVYSGGLQVQADNHAMFKARSGSSPTVLHRADENNYYILLTNPDSAVSSSWNDLRPLMINLSSGYLTSLNGQFLSGGTTVLGGLTLDGATVWSAGNDGAGSGLDADLLDGLDWQSGQNVSFGIVEAQSPQSGTTGGLRLRTDGNSQAFLQITNSNGTAQYGYLLFDSTGKMDWNGSAGIFQGGSLVWSASNDGAGSGLDADTLDGRDASEFAILASSNTFSGSLTAPGFIVDANFAVKPIGGMPGVIFDAGDYIQYDRDADIYRFRIGSSSVLELASSGLTSGGSPYDRIISSNSAENGGFIVYASGYKRCWGTATVSANAATAIAYPITFDSFSNASFSYAALSSNAQDNNPEVYSHGTSSCAVWNALDSSVTGRWRAEGY